MIYYLIKTKIDERLEYLSAIKEFKINKYLSLKLEKGITNIYVQGRLFQQYKFLLLDIPLENSEEYTDINSIDEAADRLGWQYDGQVEASQYKIDPDTEFWGHCSNLQAWVENEYDTSLLHSNLAFPLLKRLVKAGDQGAKRVFKEEIVKRLESRYLPTILYLAEEGYDDYLTRQEWYYGLFGFDKQGFTEADTLLELESIIGKKLYLIKEVKYEEFYAFSIDNRRVKGLIIDYFETEELPDIMGTLIHLKELFFKSNLFIWLD